MAATLIDSSVWIGHFRKTDPRVVEVLEVGDLLIHSAILGELAAGHLRNRVKILGDLKMIPAIPEVSSDEVLEFIELRRLFGKGLSWTDLQLLASCLASRCNLLTDDLRLRKAFEDLT